MLELDVSNIYNHRTWIHLTAVFNLFNSHFLEAKMAVAQKTSEVVEKVKRCAKSRQKPVNVEKMEVGQVIRQGDVYLMKLGGKLPYEAAVAKVRSKLKSSSGLDGRTVDGLLRPVRAYDTSKHDADSGTQLAPGTNKGSRHILFGKAQVSFPEGGCGGVLHGPVITGANGCVLTHPEHVHFTGLTGDFMVWGQLDARTMARVRD